MSGGGRSGGAPGGGPGDGVAREGARPEGVGPGEDEPYRPTPLLSVAWKVVAGLAALGALVLGVGIALPGTWTATESVTIDAPPQAVFDRLSPLDRWDDWTVWGSVEAERFGPERGVGAGRSWDDAFLGDGVFQVTAYDPPARMAYHVEVQRGSMTTDGELRLEPAGGGTRVTWTESGDFGWNPLMGYAALTMDRVQAVELRRGLQRLEALVEGRPVPDSLAIPRPGAAPPAPGAEAPPDGSGGSGAAGGDAPGGSLPRGGSA